MLLRSARSLFFYFFFFNDTATTEIYTLSLHDALPICCRLQPETSSARWFWAVCSTPDRKSTRLNSSHSQISYAVFCLKKKKTATRRRKAAHTPAPAAAPAFIPVHRFHARPAQASRPRFCLFNDTATPDIYTLSLHDALPI